VALSAKISSDDKVKQKAMKQTKKAVTARHRARLKARRPAHKRVLLHPATVFGLLCVGVLLVGASFKASASGPTDTVTFGVHGRIPAAPLTEPAVIVNPTAGTVFTQIPITVKGTCPDNSYVKLYRNDVFSGVSVCNSNAFSVQTDLFVGNNDLLPKVFNITDDEGPAGTSVRVIYSPPQPVVPAETPSGSTVKPTQPFVIKSDYLNKGYLTGQKISWTLGLSGGTPPYAVHVEWGDGTSDNYALKSSNDFTIDHVFSKPGDYIIVLNGTDGDGAHATLQLVAIVNSELVSKSSPVASITIPPGFLSGLKNWLWLAWPAYATVVLMTVSFWLGEKQEVYNLSRHKNQSRRRSSR
jgi:hypothetical protein